jgi:hypothetical protein
MADIGACDARKPGDTRRRYNSKTQLTATVIP